MTTTTVDVGTSSLFFVKRALKAAGAKIIEEKVTPGACGYTTITIQSR